MKLVQESIVAPRFKLNSTIILGKSGYSFRIDEIISREPGVYRYRGQMNKDGKRHSYGTVSEKVLYEHT